MKLLGCLGCNVYGSKYVEKEEVNEEESTRNFVELKKEEHQQQVKKKGGKDRLGAVETDGVRPMSGKWAGPCKPLP